MAPHPTVKRLGLQACKSRQIVEAGLERGTKTHSFLTQFSSNSPSSIASSLLSVPLSLCLTRSFHILFYFLIVPLCISILCSLLKISRTTEVNKEASLELVLNYKESLGTTPQDQWAEKIVF